MATRHIKYMRSLVPEGELPKIDEEPPQEDAAAPAVTPGEPDGDKVASSCAAGKSACVVCWQKYFLGFKEGGDEVRKCKMAPR